MQKTARLGPPLGRQAARERRNPLFCLLARLSVLLDRLGGAICARREVHLSEYRHKRADGSN